MTQHQITEDLNSQSTSFSVLPQSVLFDFL